jgi:hypothetical protein
MLTDWRRERFIRRVLRKLSRQRVALILQPGNVWVIEKALGGGDREKEALRTCHMRGWTDVLANAVPKMDLAPDGTVPQEIRVAGREPIYRLTDSGWQVIHRTHGWIVVTCIVAFLALLATILGLVVSLRWK